MKMYKILAGMLVLIGFGSCANRPSKSKAPEKNPAETTVQADTVRPILVMYGAPRREFDPGKAVQLDKAPDENVLNEEAPAAE